MDHLSADQTTTCVYESAVKPRLVLHQRVAPVPDQALRVRVELWQDRVCLGASPSLLQETPSPAPDFLFEEVFCALVAPRSLSSGTQRRNVYSHPTSRDRMTRTLTPRDVAAMFRERRRTRPSPTNPTRSLSSPLTLALRFLELHTASPISEELRPWPLSDDLAPRGNLLLRFLRLSNTLMPTEGRLCEGRR